MSFVANMQEKGHSENLDVNYVKINVQEVAYSVNYLKLLCNGIHGCLSYASLGSIMT